MLLRTDKLSTAANETYLINLICSETISLLETCYNAQQVFK